MGNCATVTVGTATESCVGGTLCTVPGTRNCESDAFYWDCQDGCWKKTEISCIYSPGIAGGGTVDKPAPPPGEVKYISPPSTVPGEITNEPTVPPITDLPWIYNPPTLVEPSPTVSPIVSPIVSSDDIIVENGSKEDIFGGTNSMMLVAGLVILGGILLISRK
jgi:hypothetical protein